MLAVQHQLAFARPLSRRVRSVRRPFRPSRGEGAYRLPHEVRDRLASSLAPFRNREAAFTLATFLARFHSHPDRLLRGFMIDRRELADRPDLKLTEARVRGAIKALEAIGYLERGLTTGSTHKATEEGLRRKPIAFVFGPEFAPLFLAANKRVRKAKGRAQDGGPHARRALTASPALTASAALRPSLVILNGQAAQSPLHASSGMGTQAWLLKSPLKSPKHKSEADKILNLGELRYKTGLPAEPSALSPLEAALQRLGQAIGLADGG